MSLVAPPPGPSSAPQRRPVGLLGRLTGTDHKQVALLTGATSLVFFLLSGVFALLMRTELAGPGMQVVSRDEYNQLFTMHGSGMIYLVMTPLALALGVYLVPLQVGAAEIAWPRLALLGAWLLLLGGLAMESGWLTQNGAGKATWIAIYPLSGSSSTPGPGMDLWIVGVILATLAAIAQAACVLATILRLRAPGVTMLRLPVFTWTSLVTVLMTLMSFPALIVAMALLLWQRRYGGIFDGPSGPGAYQHIFWFYGHPVVYVMFFPFVGAVAEVVAVFSGRRFFGYRPFVIALLTFAGLSMAVWGHHMFTTAQVPNEYYALTSTLLLIPAGVEYFDLLATMWRGTIRLATPMLFALGFVLQFLLGGLTGIFTASPTLDYHVHDSYFVVAHFHYTLFAGSLFGLLAGFHFWFPKVSGALLREGLGRLSFWLLVVGTNLTFLPMFWLGYDGMPRRVANYSSRDGWTGVNLLETVGSFTIAVGVLVVLVNLVVSLRRRVEAGDDPWGGHSLEWATSSPPPRWNFERLPPVRSFAPLLDLREEAARR